MRFLMRFVVVLLLIYSGLSFIRRLLMPKAPANPQGRSSAGHLVKDPVCGMYIPQETALRARDEFFCSESCRQKFIEA
jgi:hypothetical protein